MTATPSQEARIFLAQTRAYCFAAVEAAGDAEDMWDTIAALEADTLIRDVASLYGPLGPQAHLLATGMVEAWLAGVRDASGLEEPR